MRLGYRLLAERNSEWSHYYIQYSELKHVLQQLVAAAQTSSAAATDPNTAFFALLNTELEKVDRFFLRCLTEEATAVTKTNNDASDLDLLPWTDKLRRKDKLKAALIEQYTVLHLLKSFAHLNFEGFSKIMKKHEKNLQALFAENRVAFLGDLETRQFHISTEPTQLIETVVRVYASLYCGDNTGTATKKLESALKQDGRARPRAVQEDLLSKVGWIIDMDGVIYYQNNLIPGADSFVEWLKEMKKRFLFLTNSSERTPKELQQKLSRLGITVDETNFYTSGLSTAAFLSKQCPGGSCFVIGEAGLITALYDVGFTMNEVDPDYVVVGETRNFNYERMQIAINCVRNGAKLVGTNLDVYDRSLDGVHPGTACLVAPIELATGVKAYYLGKPNPLMLRNAMAKLGTTSNDTVLIGDRMDTDIIGGMEAGIETMLVLSGVSTMADVKQFAFRPGAVD